jgi:hypothetical protein
VHNLSGLDPRSLLPFRQLHFSANNSSAATARIFADTAVAASCEGSSAAAE